MNNSYGANGSSIQDIEREIDRDRSHFSETLSALESKLSPGQLVDQALGYAKRNGSDFSDNLVRSVANNPIPTILTGIGVAWMALSQNTSHAGGYSRNPSHNGAGLSEKMHRAKDKTQGFEDQMSRTAHQTGERARDLADEARHSAHEISARGRQQWEHTSQQAVNFFEENPLAIGAAAIAIGALIGAALPLTSREKELLGSKGEQLMDQVQAKTEETKETATEAGKAVAEAAKEQTAKVKPDDQKADHEPAPGSIERF